MDENGNNEEQNNMQDDILRDDLKKGSAKVKQKKQEAENKFGNQVIQQGVKQVRSAIKNAVQKKLAPFVKKTIGKVVKFLAPLITCVIIILVSIGLISFILNMPGLMRGKIDEVFQEIVSDVNLYVNGENSQLNPENITHEERLNLLNYISSDLGFDVIGLGLVPIAQYETQDSGTGEDKTGTQKIIDYDTKLGWAYFLDNEECADSDLLYYYLMANERTYIQNDDGLLGFFKGNKWTGMLNIEEEDLVNDTTINIKRAEKLLEIRNSNPHWGELLNKDVFTFSLDGWTGRYGKPVEFTLALHLATMSSGMTKELITNENLQTQVYIDLHKADCDINFRFVNADGEPVSIPFKPVSGNIGDLSEKIRNGDVIDAKTDVSICGLVEAYNTLDTKYILDEDIISGNAGGFEGISRHMETMEAVLGYNDSAVRVSDNYNYYQLRIVEPCYLPVYGCKGFETTDINAVNYLNGNYNQLCGAFICTYNDDGTPNTGSGMLNKTTSYNSRVSDGIVDSVYDIKYKYDGEDDIAYYYVLTYYDHLGNENVDSQERELGARIIIPKTNIGSWGVQIPDGPTVYRMKGLGGIYDKLINGGHFETEDIIAIKNSYPALYAAFNEIDWFLGTASINWGQFYHYPWAEFQELITTNGADNIQLNDYFYYTNLLDKINNEINDLTDIEQAEADFIQLYEFLTDDYNHLVGGAQTAVTAEEQLHNVLVDVFNADVSYEALIDIVEKLYGASLDMNNDTVEYSQPRITKVIKHWYKDIDYIGSDEDNPIAYEKDNSAITIKYTGNKNEEDPMPGFEVMIDLTPKEGEFLYKQGDKQPRVIKGETVFLDGEVIGSTEEIYGDEEADDGYCWGDGYRTTKKIFTQGYYYSFDGSAETSRSAYWQQQLEDTEDAGTYTVLVANGRVAYITNRQLKSPTKAITQDEDDNSYIFPDGVSVSFADASTGHTSGYLNHLSENTLVETYIVTINNPNSVKYLSPTQNSYEDVTKRANQINDMWKAMGVSVLRKPLSFDNVSANGEVMANTGLSILKNCDTKDADYIYRDLKEMLLDLGYYTQSEFDQLDSPVLTWFIPGYTPAVFPENSPENFNFAAIIYPYEGDDADEPLEEKDTSHHPNGALKMEGSDMEKHLAESKENMSAEDFEKYKEFLTKDNKSEKDEQKNDEESLKDSLIIENVTSDKNQTDVEKELDISEKLARGFKAGLSVVAPGDCTVISYDASAKQLEIEFDGLSQPKISMLDGYTMIITGVEFDPSVVAEGSTIKEGTNIGKTGKEPITVMLLNDIGRVLSNVEDYMCPPRINGESQPYEFTMEEVILLAYIIDHEAAPEGLTGYMKESDESVYETKEDAALAYAKAVGYVLINRALTNHGGYGTTIEEQSTAPGQYDGSFTIEYATSHQNHISAKSMEAALFCATYDCDAITNEEGITMSRDVTGESAWVWGHQIFWWLDVDHNGIMDMYAETRGSATEENPYPVNQGEGYGNPCLKEWPWDGYLTYSY